jgi:hypothetical protein
MGAVVSSIQEFFNNNIIDVILETATILPDGLVLMTGLYALLTLSASFAVMFLGLLEATAIFQVIQSFALYLGIAEGTTSSNATCRTGFRSPDFTSLSMFNRAIRAAFPSAPLYILSVASAYIFSSLHAQSEELQALGTAYSSRYYISITLLCTLILTFMLFRLYNGCDSFSVLISTVPIGIVIGALIFEQNRRLFGPLMVNLLGIPLIANKATISVCKPT